MFTKFFLKYLLIWIFIFCIYFKISSQTANISGVINTYAQVTNVGIQSVSVASTSGFSIGDKVLLLQMKGATIDTSNTSNFGTINSYNNAGNYEVLTISSITSNTIFFSSSITRTYNAADIVQLVTIPSYNNVNVVSTLSCLPWNGTVGGVLIFEATGNVVLNANIDLTGKGFLGGAKVAGQFFSCTGNSTGYKLPNTSLLSGNKGEGIVKINPSFTKGLGALGNGGGAGNDVNGGGAGGGNFGLGGHGGNSKCSSSPIALCGGREGKNCNYSTTNNKIFLGGGGGSGHENDGVSTAGVAGGGIVIIRCGGTISGNNYFINANGNHNLIVADNDGQGGGGAGGTVLLDACSSTQLNVSVKGGDGGSDNFNGPDCHGKGGGGGGGVIWTASNLSFNSFLNGGNPGVFTNSNSQCFNTSNGATAGQVGGILTGLIIPGAIPFSAGTLSLNISSVCNNSLATISGSVITSFSNPNITYTWIDSNGQIISQTNNISSLTNSITNITNGVYTLSVQINAPCGPISTQTININCASSQLCSGTLGAPVFFEDFGSGTSLYGPALSAGVTNYTYLQGVPNNGTYVISSSSNPSGTNAGYVNDNHDHTGNPNGYMMVVNSDYPASEVYRKHVTGLCPGTTYVFSAYLANNNSPDAVSNVCGASYIYANIKFQTEFPVGTILNSTISGNLAVASSSVNLPWIQYGFAFTTAAGQTSADVVLVNNAPGGCGNDYVVDDISLTPCGPGVGLNIIPNTTVFCQGQTVILHSNFTNGSYSSPQYQWQYSNDGGTTWTDVNGATSANYTISSVTSSQDGMYQLLVSENGNINLPSCRIVAGPLAFSVVNSFSLSASSPSICSGDSTTLIANGANNYTWINSSTLSSSTGSMVIAFPNTTTNYTVTGTTAACTNTEIVTVNVNSTPTITAVSINNASCGLTNGSATITSLPLSNTYTWSSGITSVTNTASSMSAGNYSIEVYNGACKTSTTITISNSSLLTFKGITILPTSCNIDDGAIVIDSIIGGTPPYIFSFNNSPYATNTSYEQLSPGSYSLSILDSNLCETSFLLTVPNNNTDYTLYIPNTFTPNNDKVNDTWFVKASCINSFNCLIFNRWGEKIIELKDINEYWDGRYKGNSVPEGVYVFVVEIDTQEGLITKAGHITLIR